MTDERAQDLANQTVIAAPSVVAVITTKILNLQINDWLGLLGIAFLLIQAAGFCWRWRRDVIIERERVANSKLGLTTQLPSQNDGDD